jgi:tetratricopeptide (TPR) repeat protein
MDNYENNLHYWIKRSGYKLYEVAEKTKIPLRTLNDYCKGRTAIPRDRLEALAAFLECSVQAIQFEEASRQKGQDMDAQRRQLLQQMFEVTGVTLLPPPQSASCSSELSSSVAIEEFSMQCAASIKACWHLLQGKGFTLAEEIVSAYIPSLTKLTFNSSKHRETAAGLATQAKILQAIMAMHKLNIVAREMHCHEAVQYSRFSADGGLQAAALMYLAFTYVCCFPRKPEKAIPIFLEALQALGDETSLLRSDIYLGLADAYAQCRDEKEALEAISLAHTHFPRSPEQDSHFYIADCGWFELHSDTGKMYLDLAQHYPDRGFYEKAYTLFTYLSGLQSAAERNTNETIIRQADAARGFGDLDLYVTVLEKGTLMALSLGSQKRYSEAYDVFQRTPERWKHEQKIKSLAKDVFRQ